MGLAVAELSPALLRSGEAALRDGLWDVAEAHYLRVTQMDSVTVEANIKGWLGVARARMGAGRLSAAEAALGHLPDVLPGDLARRETLIRAELKLLTGKAAEAKTLLEALSRESDAFDLMHVRLWSRALFHVEGPAAAVSFLEAERARYPDTPALQVELAEMLVGTGEVAEARALWETVLASGKQDANTLQALLRMIEVDLRDGDVEVARTRLDALVADGVVEEVFARQVYPLLARTLTEEGSHADAARIYAAWEARLGEDPKIWDIRPRRARALVRAGALEEADRLTRAYIAARGDDDRIAPVQLLLAEALAASGNLDATVIAYERYLAVFTDPEGLLHAHLGLAEIYEAQEEWGEALTQYERAWARAVDLEAVQPVILMKWADMYRERGDFAEAYEKYGDLLTRYPQHELAVLARFHRAVLLADLEGFQRADQALNRFRTLYPDHPLAERALLQRALVLSRFLRVERALGAFKAYEEQYPEGEFLADALTEKGVSAYHMGLFDDALRAFNDVLARFPEHERAEQAFFMRGWALYLIGEEEDARRVQQEFLQRFPASPFAVDARFWLAELAFNRRDYEAAETGFLQLTQLAADASVVSKAHYLAGRAAVARKNFPVALQQFALAIETDPEAPHVAEALFYQGDTLTELNRFDSAILVFDQLITRFPNTLLSLAARGRLGDCHFTLGEQDPARYSEALAAYRFVEESEGAPPDLQLQAGYKIGSTLEAMGRTDEALAQYILVVNRFLDQRNRYSPETANIFRRAADAAAQMYERRQDWRRAIQVYRNIVESGIPGAAQAAEQRIQDLRREHLIFF